MRSILFLFLFSSILGSGYNDNSFCTENEKIKEFKLLEKAESSGNRYAKSYLGAYGMHQITWICLKDYNRRHGTKYKLCDMYFPEISAYVAWDYLELSRRYFNYLKDDPIYYPCVYSSYNVGRGGTLKKWKGRKVFRIYLRYIGLILSDEKMKRFHDNYYWIHSETKHIKYFIHKKEFFNVLSSLPKL